MTNPLTSKAVNVKKKLSAGACRPIRLYNRHSQAMETEQVYGRRLMDICYGTRWGRWIEAVLLCRHPMSRLYGRLQNHPWSRRLIDPFVEQCQIDLSQAQIPSGGFGSFNSFFIRQLKASALKIDLDPSRMISPADSRLQVFRIQPDLSLQIKGLAMTLPQVLGIDQLAPSFQGGLCLCYRLAPCDYHRFGYVETGVQGPVHTVHGPLHSVSPLAMRHKPDILATNYRQWCWVQGPGLETLIQVEVGAMMVGSIVQNQPHGGSCRRGQEKGYFQFGGSTVLILLPTGRLELDPDIEHYSAQGIETLVRYGESVGRLLEG